MNANNAQSAALPPKCPGMAKKSNRNNYAFVDLNAIYEKEGQELMQKKIYHEKDRILGNIKRDIENKARGVFNEQLQDGARLSLEEL